MASIAAIPAVPTTPLVTNLSGSNNFFTFPAYVPSGYWAELTITQLIGAPTASVNAQWQPV